MAAPSLKEIDIPVELSRIKSMGYIPTMRVGDTGVGYTLETLLGLRETNKRGKQDFCYKNIPTELKSPRRSTSSMMTLFTREPDKTRYNDRYMIKKYGYIDKKGRNALKITLTTRNFVPQGLKLRIDKINDKLIVVDIYGNELWYWIIQKLKPKIGSLVIVFADTRGRGENESFHYNEAFHLHGLNNSKLFDLFDLGIFVVDFRMHLKPNGSVRNRGTAFRMRGLKNLFDCYQNVDQLI